MTFVRYRSLWYFHGFDPSSTARYRRIFEGASDMLGVLVKDLPEDAPVQDGWRARRAITQTDVHYLRYDDLVRDAQAGSVLTRIGRGVRSLVGYVTDGAFARMHARSIALAVSPYLVAFGPVVALALTSGASIAAMLIATVPLAVLAYVLLWRLKMILATDLFAYMRVLAKGRGTHWDAYQDRLVALGDQISGDAADETLVVGHSLGGVAAIRATARLLEGLPQDRSVSLLTLGSVHGLVLAQKGAGRDALADAIAVVAADKRVTWVDVTSPRDAFCVPLTDPLLMIGDRAQPGMTSPRVISAQLQNVARIPGDRRTVFGAMRRHMGYLLEPPAGAGFDYADIVTGPETLADRFEYRGNSPRARMWHG